MPAAISWRSTGPKRCAASGAPSSAGNHTKNHDVRDCMAPIYLLLFASPQLLLFLYLRERLPLGARRWLAGLFIVFNIPWVIVAVRIFSGSLWGISRIPYIAPFITWQFLGWVFCGLIVLYLIGKGIWWLIQKVRAEWGVVRDGAHPQEPLPTPHSPLPCFTAPVPRPGNVRLRSRGRRLISLRHLERRATAGGHPTHAGVR